MRWLKVLVSACLAAFLVPHVAWAQDDAGGTSQSDAVHVTDITSERMSIGGGGALFDPAVSPFDADDMAVGTDMGDVYVTRDGGSSWKKKATGRAYDILYDPTRKGTVYVCGSGIWRSADYGENFELMWPKAEHATGEPTKYEDLHRYLFNTDGYNQASEIISIAVDRANGDNIYALAIQTRYNAEWVAQATEVVLHGSADGGATFSKLAAKDIGTVGNIDYFYDNSKVLVHDGCPWVCVKDGIFAYDANSQGLVTVYEPDKTTYHSLLEIEQTSSDGCDGLDAGTYYWTAESLDAGNATNPPTSLRRFHVGTDGTPVFEDFTGDMNNPAKGLNRTYEAGGTTVDLGIKEIAATSATRVYFTAYATSSVNAPAGVATLLARYDAAKTTPFKWMLGHQVGDGVRLNADVPIRMDLQNLSYGDSYLLMYGLAASPAAPNRFLLAGGAGLYGTPDCEVENPKQTDTYPRTSNIYQLYANRHANENIDAYGGYGDADDKYTFSSTGIDNVTTYGVRVDPFDPNHVAILYTDQALVLSNDGAKTWSKKRTGDNRDWDPNWLRVPVTWENTIYDLEFDPYVKGRMYGLWSGRHDAPYTTAYWSDPNAHGGFAVADMTDDNWKGLVVNWKAPDGSELTDRNAGTANSGTVLPENSIPVKFDVVYPADEAARASGESRTFWVACFGKGFYRSSDSGKTFEEVNSGVADKTDGLVYAADIEANDDGSQVFGITARRTDRSGINGKVYRWDSSAAAWAEIALPSSVEGNKTHEATCPRDIFWDDARETLYISCVAANDRQNAQGAGYPDFYNHHGGIYVWHPGDAQAAPLDADSAAVGDASNIEGVSVDSAGNVFASDMRGNIWLRCAGNDEFEKIYDQFHTISKNVQLLSESVSGSVHTDTIILPSFGGGTLKMHVKLTEPASEDPGADDPGSNPNGSGSGGSGANTPDAKPDAAPATRVDISNATVELAASSLTYSGKACTPAIKEVTLAGKPLSAATDYTVSYSSNVNVGAATATVTGTGAYEGNAHATFHIVPKGTSIKKLKASTRGFKAQWKKQAKQTSGYQVQYALKKSFKKAKTVKIAKSKTTSKKISKLKPKKRYYVRIRTYKKTGADTYYSAWSKAKSVKTKK